MVMLALEKIVLVLMNQSSFAVAIDFNINHTHFMNRYVSAIQCTGRNPSQKSIDKYWTQYGGTHMYGLVYRIGYINPFVSVGAITLTQFCNIMRRETPPTLDHLITLFKKFDKDNDGMIDKSDLMKLLTRVC